MLLIHDSDDALTTLLDCGQPILEFGVALVCKIHRYCIALRCLAWPVWAM